MFTIEQIQQAHSKVKSGADFPAYIREIKALGVKGYHTWVTDGHTQYFGVEGYEALSPAKYESLVIAENSNKQVFVAQLREHQQGKSDYKTFCNQCAKAGVEKWVVDLDKMTCTYYDKAREEMLVETIPG